MSNDKTTITFLSLPKESGKSWMQEKDQDKTRSRDWALSSLSLLNRQARRLYLPLLLRDVTLQMDHIGSFLCFLSNNADLSHRVESLSFINLSPSRRFESATANESAREAALRIWKGSAQRCLEASHCLLQLDSEEEAESNLDDDEDNHHGPQGPNEDDTDTLTPVKFKKRRKDSFKTSLLYLYYAKGAIVESCKNLKRLRDETYVLFPLIRRTIWDGPLGGLQSLKRLTVEHEIYDSNGISVPATTARNLIWFLLFLPSLVQGRFKIGLDRQDIPYLQDHFDCYNQASKMRELILQCELLPKDSRNPIWNAKLRSDSMSRLLLATKHLQALDLVIPDFSIPDFLSCLKSSLSSSFNTLSKLKLSGDPRKNLHYVGPPEFSGRPVITHFSNLESIILDSDFVLSLQVSKDGIPMPSQRSDIDGIIMRLADKLPLEPIKLRKLTTLTILSSDREASPNSNSNSNPNSNSSTPSNARAKKMESTLRNFIAEHHLTPNLTNINLCATPTPFSLNRRPSSSKSARKSSNSFDSISALCEKKNLSLTFLEPGQSEFIPFSPLQDDPR